MEDGVRPALVQELKRLRDLKKEHETEETTMRRMWRALMSTEPPRVPIETRWVDYQKFRAEVYMMIMHGVI
jgi:hypothetical protein